MFLDRGRKPEQAYCKPPAESSRFKQQLTSTSPFNLQINNINGKNLLSFKYQLVSQLVLSDYLQSINTD